MTSNKPPSTANRVSAMTEPSTQLSEAEALAIDAISGAAKPALAETTPTEPDISEHHLDAHFELPIEAPAAPNLASGPETPAYQDPTLDADEEHADDEDMLAMRATMLDSAELANRAAGMAARSATEMHGAATKLIAAHSAQRINGIVVLATFGALMITAMALFGIMSYRLQVRIAQADAMLLAVGKRIVSMDESMELITSAGEALRDIASRQDSIVGGQMKLDARLDEIIAANLAVAQAASKPADTKGPDLAKLLQALDAKVQSQSSALNALSSQVRATPTPRPDPAVVRREVEAAMRQQKAAEVTAKPAVVVPVAPPAPPAKPKESLVQYPRTKAAETP